MTRGTKVEWGVRRTSFGGKTQCFWGGGVRKLPGLKPRLRVLALASFLPGRSLQKILGVANDEPILSTVP